MPRRIVVAVAAIVAAAVVASPAAAQDPAQDPNAVLPPPVTAPAKPGSEGPGMKGLAPGELPFMATRPDFVASLRPGGGASRTLTFTPAETHCYTSTGRPYQRVGRYRWALRSSSVSWRLVAVYDPVSRRFVSEAASNLVVCAAWQLPRRG